MKQQRRYMALLMALVYLTTMGAEAFMSLCCPCVRRLHGPACTSGCCHIEHCCSAAAATCDGIHFERRCCDNRHSNEVELYTLAGNEEMRRLQQLVVLRLLAVQQNEISFDEIDSAPLMLERSGPPIAPLNDGVAAIHALRAPPIMA